MGAVVKYALSDAAQLAAENPSTFTRPPSDALARIQTGDLVKLCFTPAPEPKGPEKSERMWCMVESRKGDHCIGKLANHPVFVPAKWGDAVRFELRHVYDLIHGPED